MKKIKLKPTTPFAKRLYSVIPSEYDCSHECSYGCDSRACEYADRADAAFDIREQIVDFMLEEGLLEKK